jgi:hypothetical protein
MWDARALVEHAPMSADASEETQQTVIGYRDAMTYVQQTPLMEFFDHSETPGRESSPGRLEGATRR